MKRHGNLWYEITDYSNILLAAKKAQKGKRFRDSVLAFNYNLENELLQLKIELETQTYKPGAYKTFTILEPKPRIISAAPYRDRIIHHAIHNIVQPIFERGFIFDSYANRVGFGTHRALRRFTKFARSSTYILQCDIKKYFASIDHEILKNLVRNKIKCVDTLWLIDKVIDNSNPQELVIEYFPGDDLLTPTQHRRGLPIGNLTSQFLSNVYLNEFDHFIKRQLKIEKYIRYVDDFALFGEDKQALAESRIAIEEYLTQLRLKLHPIKSQLFKTNHGANFLFPWFPYTTRPDSSPHRKLKAIAAQIAKNATKLYSRSNDPKKDFPKLTKLDSPSKTRKYLAIAKKNIYHRHL